MMMVMIMLPHQVSRLYPLYISEEYRSLTALDLVHLVCCLEDRLTEGVVPNYLPWAHDSFPRRHSTMSI